MIKRDNRFRNRNDLLKVLRKGRNVRGNGFSVRTRPSSTPRVAVVVSKKVSKLAVTRNKIRRRIFEIFRPILEAQDLGQDIVVIVHDASLAKNDFTRLQQQVKDAVG